MNNLFLLINPESINRGSAHIISSFQSAMSETKLHFIGDSNVDRHFMAVKSTEEDPYLSGATLTRAVNLLQLQEALSTPVELHSTVVVAALTNPTTSHVFTNFSGVKAHCDHVFSQVQAWVNDGRTAVPGAMQKVSCFN
jgi:hypothetical protein